MPHMLCYPDGGGHLTICTDALPGCAHDNGSAIMVDVQVHLSLSVLLDTMHRMAPGQCRIRCIAKVQPVGPHSTPKMIRSDDNMAWRMHGSDHAPRFHVYSHELFGAVVRLLMLETANRLRHGKACHLRHGTACQLVDHAICAYLRNVPVQYLHGR